MKKLIVPLIFALLFIAITVMYAITILIAPVTLFIKISFGILIGIIAITMVYIFVQRVKEFKEEEKDDLSKY
ncbi:MAG: hypothetical protein KAG94_04445 [Clostridiales bacterium]|nr:hypothetical protein [Clostridiales bacterium]